MRDVILHNPRCSKSRRALEILEERGAGIPVREYLRDTPSIDELRELVRLLGVRPIDIVRKGEDRYRELGLDEKEVDDETMFKLMVENPVLIERPIVVRGNRAIVGRPPERVLEIL